MIKRACILTAFALMSCNENWVHGYHKNNLLEIIKCHDYLVETQSCEPTIYYPSQFEDLYYTFHLSPQEKMLFSQNRFFWKNLEQNIKSYVIGEHEERRDGQVFLKNAFQLEQKFMEIIYGEENRFFNCFQEYKAFAFTYSIYGSLMIRMFDHLKDKSGYHAFLSKYQKDIVVIRSNVIKYLISLQEHAPSDDWVKLFDEEIETLQNYDLGL